ncbi:MAG: ferrochelatase [Actinomycetes bacterium]
MSDFPTAAASAAGSSTAPYDAVLLVSFGGPEGPDDVIPFLENVTRGRGIPRERLEAVGEHYFHFGGVSPIQQQCRDLLAAIRAELAGAGLDVPVYWGNRNWDPYLTETMRQLAEDGHQRVAAFVTSAYASSSGCRQYREDLARALAPLGEQAPYVDKLRHYFSHPGFVEPQVDAVLDALQTLPGQARDGAVLAFVTHSIPTAMNDVSGPLGGAYVSQHTEVASVVAQRVAERLGREVPWELVYCSRSGPPTQPWLEPDINDHLERLSAEGAASVVMVPIGFISDHMEVVYDLDTEATETAERLKLPVARAATVGTDPRFVAAIRDLVLERAAVERGEAVTRAVVPGMTVSHDVCPVGCCRNLRAAETPAAAGADGWRPTAAVVDA